MRYVNVTTALVMVSDGKGTPVAIAGSWPEIVTVWATACATDMLPVTLRSGALESAV
jgi:hypothetical protein